MGDRTHRGVDNAFALMAELHLICTRRRAKVQYPMKNAGSLDLLATKQIDMTPRS